MIFKKCSVGNVVFGEPENKNDVAINGMSPSALEKIYSGMFN
jgi:hypothetical protein